MGRMSFTQELKALAKASEGMDTGGCWGEVLHLHRELGRTENALGRAAWTMRYGQPGEWRMVLREAAAETLHEGRRASERSDTLDHSTPLTRPPPSAVQHRRRRNARLARDLWDPHRDLVLVAPAPVFARLERVDQRVAV